MGTEEIVETTGFSHIYPCCSDEGCSKGLESLASERRKIDAGLAVEECFILTGIIACRNTGEGQYAKLTAG